jgi:low temperature requirement protein LtrA
MEGERCGWPLLPPTTSPRSSASGCRSSIGRTAYPYLHIPMVAGIIVTAVGDELTIAEPRHTMTTVTTTALLLGPALFLAGHLLFQRTVSGTWLRSRLIGLAALLLLVPVAAVTERIVLSFLTTLTVMGVAASDTLLTTRPPRRSTS